MTKNHVKSARFGHQVLMLKSRCCHGQLARFWSHKLESARNNILVLTEIKVSTWAVVVLTWITRVIFFVFLAKRGESEASAKRELGASAGAPGRQLGKYTKKLQVADESYWTVSPVQFTEQFRCESICCWFKSLYLIVLRLRKTFEDHVF